MIALELINRQSYISRGITGKGAVVAVIDSGFDVSHPGLVGKIIGQLRMRDKSQDLTGSTAASTRHGTAVASIVAAVAPDARLILLNTETSLWQGVNGAGLVAEAIDFARAWRGPNGECVAVINMSFGGSGLTVMREAIQRAVADGILCVAAAGNAGDGDPTTDEKSYPAMWPETVSVGAHGTDMTVKSYSNSNLEIDVVAPGDGLMAANSSGGYSSFSGTSAAAPIVAGAAALIYEELTQRLGRRPSEREFRYELLRNTTMDGIIGNTDPRLIGVGRLYLQERGDDDMTRDEFIRTVAPVAVKVRVDGGVLYPSVSIAQMILETGGKIHSWYNLVGYKVGSGKQTPYWRGKSVSKSTWEVYDGSKQTISADFRAYDSIEDCLKDQALLFIHNPGRYQRVIDARSPGEQAKMLQECGYATDPAYADKIMAIIRSHGLDIYDEEADRAMERLSELEQRVQAAERVNMELSSRLQDMEKQHSMPVPTWAQDAVDAAVQAGYIDTPNGGSIDFYRFVTIMHRAGVFTY